jgi:hypothetical protein
MFSIKLFRWDWEPHPGNSEPRYRSVLHGDTEIFTQTAFAVFAIVLLPLIGHGGLAVNSN